MGISGGDGVEVFSPQRPYPSTGCRGVAVLSEQTFEIRTLVNQRASRSYRQVGASSLRETCVRAGLELVGAVHLLFT